jgi:RHS repeat-associated protein
MNSKNFSSTLLAIGIAMVSGMLSGFTLYGQQAAQPVARPPEYDFSAPIGPHHRLVDKLIDTTDANAQLIQHHVRYTVLASGLNYWDGTQWVESEEKIVADARGAIAAKGQYQVVFGNNLNRSGTIEIRLSDGQVIKNHPLGIYYFDATDGRWAKLSDLKDCTGEILPPNQVIYRDAFASLRSDVRYTYQRGQFEADIILREQAPDPAAFGFDPATTRLVIVSEFLGGPDPNRTLVVVKQETDTAKRTLMAVPDLIDEQLDFGSLRFGEGTAFDDVAADQRHPNASPPIVKQWNRIGQRRFLWEQIEYAALQPLVAKLPVSATKADPTTLTSGTPQFPIAPAATAAPVPFQDYAVQAHSPGVVLDYWAISGSTNSLALASGVTYHVTGNVDAHVITFYSGSIVKFKKPGLFGLKTDGFAGCYISGGGSILTGEDDNTIGDIISTGELTGTYAGNALGLYWLPQGTNTVSSMDIRFAQIAVSGGNTSPASNHLFSMSSYVIHSCTTGFRTDGNETYTVTSPCFENVATQYSGSNITHSGDTTCANTAPVIRAVDGSSTIGNIAFNEETSGSQDFLVTDLETRQSGLTVTATSNNTTLIPISGIGIVRTGGRYTVSLFPGGDQNGTATITITATDPSAASATKTFTVTVNAVNDPPWIGTVTDQSVRVGKSRWILVNVGDIDSNIANLTVTPSWTGTLLTGYTTVGSGAQRAIKFTSTADNYGTVPVTLTVSDGQLTTQTSFTMTIRQDYRDPDGYLYAYYMPGDVPGSVTKINPSGGGGGGSGGGGGGVPDISGLQKLQVEVGSTCWDAVAGLTDQDIFDITTDQEDTYVLPPDDGRPYFINVQVTANLDDWGQSTAGMPGMVWITAPQTGPDCGMQQITNWGNGFQNINYCTKYSLTYQATLASNVGVTGGKAWVSNVGLIPADDDGGCSQCDATLASLKGAAGSMALQLGLAKNEFGRWAQNIFMHESYPSPMLASPKCLNTSVIAGFDSDVVKAADGSIRQLRVPKGLIDVLTVNQFKFSLNFYDNTMIGNGGAKLNGLYVTNANAVPLNAFEISNPSQTTNDCTYLNVIENRGGTLINNQYWYAPTNGGNPAKWEFTQANSLRRERREYVTNGITRTETLSVINPANSSTIRKHQTKLLTLGSMDVVIEKTYDPDVQQIKATYVYWTNVTDYGYGKLRQEILPNGQWKTLEYDSQARIQRICSSFTNQNLTTDTNLGRAVVYDYTLLSGSGDNGTYRQQLPRTEARYALGKEVGRTYYVYKRGEKQEIVCTVPGAEWYDSANLVTITKRVDSGFFKDELSSLKQPDGTMTFYSYTTNSTSKTTTVDSGQPNGGATAIVDGARTITVVGSSGHTISNIVVDLVSNIILSQETYSNFDAQYRAQRVDYLDATFETMTYGCCGLMSKTDRDGVTTTYAYDDLKRLTSETRLGITTSYTYDVAGHVLTVSRQGTSGSPIAIKQSAYDLAGRLIVETNAVGVVTTYSEVSDGTGQTIRTTTYAAGTADAATRIETYGRDGALLKVTGTAVNPVRFDYGVELEGSVQRAFKKEIKLDASGNDTSEWTKTYSDTAGRTYKTVFNASSGTPNTQSYFNPVGQLSKQVDPDGVIMLYDYNLKGEPRYSASDTNRNGSIETNGLDRITWTTNDVIYNSTMGANVRRTRTFVYPNANDGNTTVEDGRVETSTDGLKTWTTRFGLVTKVQTAFVGGGSRSVTTTNPDNSYTIAAYQNGRLTSVTRYDSTGTQIGLTSYTYDAHGRQATMTDARNGTSTYSYDNADRIISASTPPPGTGQSAQTTTSSFDNLGRVWKIVQPDGSSVTNEYWSAGQLKRTYGTRTYPVGYSYDSQGRITSMTNWTTFASGAGARVTTWTYEQYRGFLLGKRDANNLGCDYTYTLAGRLATRTWARGSPRTATTYAYDTLGVLSSVTYSNDGGITPQMSYAYDRRGRRTQSLCNAMTTTMVYNDAGLQVGETYVGGTLGGLTITNIFDATLRRTQNTLLITGGATQTSATFGYDSASRLSSVSDGTYSASYTYLANSPLLSQITFKQTTNTRMTTTKQYDYLNRLLSIQSSAGVSPVASFAHQYNDANQRISVTLADGSYWLYQYDQLGQVISGKRFWSDGAPVPGQQYEYGFDDIGNRTTTKAGGDASGQNLRSATYTGNNLNQYSSRTVPGAFDVVGLANVSASVTVSGSAADYRRGEYFQELVSVSNASVPVWQSVSVTTSGGGSASGNVFVPKTAENYTYDLDGNTTQDGRWSYTFDAENRLTSMQGQGITGLPTGANKKLDFEYDCQGRRISKKSYNWNGSSYVLQYHRKFVYDGWNLIAEWDGLTGAQLRSFMWGSDLSGSVQGAGGVGGLLSMKPAGGAAHFTAYDGNGNVAALIDGSAGTVSANYEYSPFGETIRATGTMALTNPLRFSTKFTDDESDFLYYGYRFYNPSTGRWLSRDPIGEQGGKNLYGFVQNNPENLIDPHGKAGLPLIIGIGVGLLVCGDAAACALRVSGQLWDAFHEVRNKTGRDPSPAGTQEDALKHCVASCNLAKSPRYCLSAALALWVTNQHEDGKTPASQMDIANNRAGNSVGRGNPADCFVACQGALAAGSLTCLDENNQPVPCTPREQ